MLYRSGRLDSATADDRRKLVHDYGINIVIGLRTKPEHIIREQRGHYGNGLDELGVRTVNVHFISKKFEMALVKQLGWWDVIKVVVLMIFGFRATAIRIIGEKVVKSKGLAGLSLASLEYCGEEIRSSLEILCDQSAYPVLMHCTQGKDRTGLLSILLLLLLKVPIDAIKKTLRAQGKV
ncbi:hypothetical protein L873DRAFT_1941245 [Choiromyces venosus 120613-1]|uniref:Tyrosine specific protein phosphatases domain-containing protein n=1 Tax=Choiromyces venosus 120613-1 TaxID=1336337 RepID=A0A3N4JBW4_9PEZI|nr:hypothetical protein L873DRAFT_1941245 [Choiromyces venosus 120613-1]